MHYNTRMKKREIFSQIKIPTTAVVRIDGRGFGKVLKQLDFQKPYDIRFTKAMADSTEDFYNNSGITPSLVFIFSDEINLVFSRDIPFNGRLEKIDSVIPSFFSSALVINLGSTKPLSFDSRVLIIDRYDISEYLIWRQEECWRNLMSSYAYYFVRDEGLNVRQAQDRLKGLKTEELHELAWSHGTNLSQTPSWQRRGILIYKQKNRIIQDWEPPIFKKETGIQFINKIIENSK